MTDELTMLRRIAKLAKAVVDNSAWVGVCDEDIELERIVKEYFEQFYERF